MLDSIATQRASKRERRLNAYLWVFLVVTNCVDVLASRRAYESGIAEANPLVDMIIAESGVIGLSAFKGVWIVMLLLLLPYIKGWTQWLFAVACLVYFALTLSHLSNLSPLL